MIAVDLNILYKVVGSEHEDYMILVDGNFYTFHHFSLTLCEITPSKLVHRGWLLQVVRRGSDIFGATPQPDNIGRDVMDVMEAMEAPVSQRVGTCWEQQISLTCEDLQEHPYFAGLTG